MGKQIISGIDVAVSMEHVEVLAGKSSSSSLPVPLVRYANGVVDSAILVGEGMTKIRARQGNEISWNA